MTHTHSTQNEIPARLGEPECAHHAADHQELLREPPHPRLRTRHLVEGTSVDEIRHLFSKHKAHT